MPPEHAPAPGAHPVDCVQGRVANGQVVLAAMAVQVVHGRHHREGDGHVGRAVCIVQVEQPADVPDKVERERALRPVDDALHLLKGEQHLHIVQDALGAVHQVLLDVCVVLERRQEEPKLRPVRHRRVTQRMVHADAAYSDVQVPIRRKAERVRERDERARVRLHAALVDRGAGTWRKPAGQHHRSHQQQPSRAPSGHATPGGLHHACCSDGAETGVWCVC